MNHLENCRGTHMVLFFERLMYIHSMFLSLMVAWYLIVFNDVCIAFYIMLRFSTKT